MLKTQNIIRKVQKTDKQYNILTFNTHERYQTQLAKTGQKRLANANMSVRVNVYDKPEGS